MRYIFLSTLHERHTGICSGNDQRKNTKLKHPRTELALCPCRNVIHSNPHPVMLSRVILLQICCSIRTILEDWSKQTVQDWTDTVQLSSFVCVKQTGAVIAAVVALGLFTAAGIIVNH